MIVYRSLFFLYSISFTLFCIAVDSQITPFKYQSGPERGYVIPPSCTFAAPRSSADAPNIRYYLSKPSCEQYPIAVLCAGSTSRDNIHSVICFHRYFLQEFLDLGCAVLTVEQWGIDGDIIDEKAFIKHYTRTQRFSDHCDIVKHLQAYPPEGWDGTFVLLGVSEGGPLVTALTTHYPDIIRATINWCGAGDWSWQDELWAFLEGMRRNGSWWDRLCWKFFFWLEDIPNDCSEYDVIMDTIKDSDSTEDTFMGMSYKYHADALAWKKTNHEKIRTPFLVVVGVLDTFIDSCDLFVANAQKAGALITYIRVDDMDHYIRKHPNIIEKSFDWLKKFL